MTPCLLSQQSVVLQHDEKALQKVKRGANVSVCTFFSQKAMWKELCDQRSNKPVDMLHRLSWEGAVAIATTPQAVQVNGGKF